MDDFTSVRGSAIRAQLLDWGVKGRNFWQRRRQTGGFAAREEVQRFALGFFIVLFAMAAMWPLLPRRYEATAAIIIRPTDQDGQFDYVQSMRQPMDENAIQSEMDFIRSPILASKVIARHQLAYDPEFGQDPRAWRSQMAGLKFLGGVAADPPTEADVTRRLNEHLQVWRDRRSYTVRVGYWSTDPAKALSLTQTLLGAYIDEQVTRKRKAVETLSGWLDQRVKLLQAKYDRSEQAVRSFMSESGLDDSGAQLSLENQLATLSTELAQARARSIDAGTRARYLARMRQAGTLESAPDVLVSPSVQRLKETLAAAMAKPTVWSSETQAINAQIAAESQRIVQGAETEARNWEEREALLQREIASIRDQMTARKRAEFRLEELRRVSAVDKTVLDDALTRARGQAARVDAMKPDAEVLVPAELPARPIFPSPLLFALASLFAALLGGAMMVWRPLVAQARSFLVVNR